MSFGVLPGGVWLGEDLEGVVLAGLRSELRRRRLVVEPVEAEVWVLVEVLQRRERARLDEVAQLVAAATVPVAFLASDGEVPSGWLSSGRAADRLGVRPQAVRKRVRAGKLTGTYVRGRLYVSPEEVEQWEQERACRLRARRTA